MHINLRGISAASVVIASLLASCGGGDGGSSPSAPSNAPQNSPPAADAGMDQRVLELGEVSLWGSGTDVDGSIATFSWTQTDGLPVSLDDATSASPKFMAPAVTATTTLSFKLEVTDDRGATASDTVTVTVLRTGVVSGRVGFDRVPFQSSTLRGLDYPNTFDAPVRGAVIEAISAADRTTILASGNTDADGNYSLAFGAGTAFFLRVKAQMQRDGAPSWNFRVVDNMNGDALYALDSTDLVNDGTIRDLRARAVWDGSTYTTRAAAPFAILDSVYVAFQTVLDVSPQTKFPALDVHWSAGNHDSSDFDPDAGDVGTYYRSDGVRPGIYLLGTQNVDTDEFDSPVIIHEWAHYFQKAFSRDDSVGGEHSLSSRLDFRVAFSEGWGNAFAGIASGDSRYRDSSGSQQGAGFTIDVEQNPNPTSMTQNGWYSEMAVQSTLYDIFDSVADAGDTVALGFAPIHEAMTNQVRNTEALTTIYPLLTALKADNPVSAAGIDMLANARGIVAADDYGSTETNNGGSSENLPLYRTLAIGAAPIQLCSRTNFGEVNRLGNRRFVRFSVPGTQQMTFRASSATPGADPDLQLFHGGAVATSEENSTSNGTEQFSRALTAGDYVLEVYDFMAADGDTSTPGSCMSVSINSP